MNSFDEVETVMKKDNYTILPRGGYLVDTSFGYIQFGSPPETIKDTMAFEKGVPRIFVLMNKMFDWIKGISLAEIEFPIYFNFFIKKSKIVVICREAQLSHIKIVLQEAVFGPKELDLVRDFDTLTTHYHIPDLRKEMNFFRNNLQLSDLVEFKVFKNKTVTIRDIHVKLSASDGFEVWNQQTLLCRIPGELEYKARYQIGRRLLEPYQPPLFGITCLGPSHGFDPKENTSGYVIWLNHHGIMVDPPVNSTEWLQDSNVTPKLIDTIILTHCHADHDAGTFQKILDEGKTTIYSTETVMMSFLRKYSALSNIPISYLLKLFDFHPIKIGKPVFIHGGRFEMFYTLHSIPTFGFKMAFQDQTMVYSSDHNNDPEIHKRLYDSDTISKERYEQFCRFPWDSKIIYHESGIAPLHTPIHYLNSLDEEIQKKIVVYHIAKKDFPQETNLTQASFGIENTLIFPTQQPAFAESYQILNVLKHIDFFQDLGIDKAQEFLTIVDKEKFKKGDLIVKKDSFGDKFYIISSGNISVDGDNLKMKKLYGTYEYFGEVALITGQKRTADVHAETDIVVFTIGKDKFLNFIDGTDFEKTLIKLVQIRTSETWNLLSTSKFFRYCTSTQKTWLESIFIPVSREGAGMLIKEGDHLKHIYILRSGEIQVSQKQQNVIALKKGDFIGAMHKVHRNEPAEYTYYHKESVSLFAMARSDILQFVDKNPGVLMKFVYEF